MTNDEQHDADLKKILVLIGKLLAHIERSEARDAGGSGSVVEQMVEIRYALGMRTRYNNEARYAAALLAHVKRGPFDTDAGTVAQRLEAAEGAVIEYNASAAPADQLLDGGDEQRASDKLERYRAALEHILATTGEVATQNAAGHALTD